MTIGEQQPIDMNIAKIELSEIEAALFIEFQKNYEKFSLLEKAGIFNIRNGQAVISFDPDGTIQAIDLNVASYRKGKKVLHIVSVGV